MTIEDVAGRSLPAKSIFTSSIKALVDHFKKSFEKQNVSNVTDNDIKWVLTVPAIWSDAAKKFMRLCATDVSIFFSQSNRKTNKMTHFTIHTIDLTSLFEYYDTIKTICKSLQF